MTQGGAVSHRVERCAPAHRSAWLGLRRLIWPQDTDADHAADMAKILAEPSRNAAFLCRLDGGAYAGFAEAAMRTDYVNGCETSPVAFLEAVFVEPARRRKGIARALCGAVEEWARQQGSREFASDADIANRASHRMHAALGFAETGRVVYFRKLLA
jgi:aminoglycoside 6'-N-acetyltransferase I